MPQDEKGGDRVPVKIPYNDGENYDDYGKRWVKASPGQSPASPIRSQAHNHKITSIEKETENVTGHCSTRRARAAR